QMFEMVDIDGLGKILVGAQLDRLYRVWNLAFTRYHDGEYVLPPLAHLAQDREPVGAGEPELEQHDMRVEVENRGERSETDFRSSSHKGPRRDQFSPRVSGRGIVLNDQ